MAKKKTENIKAAPVLRAQSEGNGSGDNGGEQPTPVITKSYCVRDDWKDKDKVNYVAFKSVDGEVQDLTVNGEPAGGGGTLAGYDIISVTVTATNNVIPFTIANLVDFDNNGELRGAYIINNNYYVDMSQMIAANSTQTFNLLHKSGITFESPVTGTPVITGNATYSNNTIYITGDCSITV